MTPEQIAGQLTEAQRAAIVNATDKMSSHGGFPYLTVRHTGEPWLMPVEAHDAFRQEVSDAVEAVIRADKGGMPYTTSSTLSRFIIQPKPDPLADVVADLYGVFNEGGGPADTTDYLRAALKSRGLEIREVGE